MNIIEKLLTTYSVSELIIIFVAFALAIKGLITFYDWAADRVRKVFNKQSKQEQEKQEILNKIDSQTERIETLIGSMKKLSDENRALKNKLDVLFESDKDDIRAWITERHQYFMSLGYIDDYSLDCLERRYQHYRDEGGNSYIKLLMEDLRKLPQTHGLPPAQQ